CLFGFMGRGVSQGYTGTAPGAMGGRRALKATVGREHGTLVPVAREPGAAKSKRSLVDLSARAHEPMLARERLAGEAVGPPVRRQDRWEGPEIGGRNVADRMARFLVDHHLLRPLHRLDQPLGMLDRAQFLAFAGDDEIGRADLVGMALPGDVLAEAVELVL